jgi:hypothetical protein
VKFASADQISTSVGVQLRCPLQCKVDIAPVRLNAICNDIDLSCFMEGCSLEQKRSRKLNEQILILTTASKVFVKLGECSADCRITVDAVCVLRYSPTCVDPARLPHLIPVRPNSGHMETFKLYWEKECLVGQAYSQRTDVVRFIDANILDKGEVNYQPETK